MAIGVRGFFDMLWPRFCVGCERFGGYLCRACRDILLRSVRVDCSGTVGGCDGVVTACVPTPLLRAVIHQFKYVYSTELGAVLGELMARVVRDVWVDRGTEAGMLRKNIVHVHMQNAMNSNKVNAADGAMTDFCGTDFVRAAVDFDGAGFSIVPVPLHAARERERGFNQSIILGRAAGEVLHVPVRSLLTRTRATSPQARLSRAERLINVHDAFRYITDFAPVPYTVLLIDDVITTGATISACASALRLAGVSRVYALALARGL